MTGEQSRPRLLGAREALIDCARALDELPRRYREVPWLRTVEGLSTTETATQLRLSPGNVRVTLHRARQRLLASTSPAREMAPRDSESLDEARVASVA